MGAATVGGTGAATGFTARMSIVVSCLSSKTRRILDTVFDDTMLDLMTW